MNSDGNSRRDKDPDLQRWLQREETWNCTKRQWEQHVHTCRCLMKSGIISRMEMAAEASRKWGHEARVTGIFDTQTCTGVLHLRAKLLLEFGRGVFSRLEFIGSPSSCTIGIEGERTSSRRRWPKIPLNSEAIENHADAVIQEFLRWGVIRREA